MKKSILNPLSKFLYCSFVLASLCYSNFCWGFDFPFNEASQSLGQSLGQNLGQNLGQDVIQELLREILEEVLEEVGHFDDSDLGYEVIHDVFGVFNEGPEILEELVNIPESAMTLSPLILGGLIFFLTFLIEEVAIAASAYFVGMRSTICLFSR